MTPSIGGYCFYIDVDEYRFNFIVVLSCEWSTTVLKEVPCKGLTDDEIREQGKSWIKKFQLDLFNSMKGFLAKNEQLKSTEKAYILIRSDRRGRDAVELCFKTKEAAEKYLQAERQSMTYDEDLYDIIEEKILSQ